MTLSAATLEAKQALSAHMRKYQGQLLGEDTFAGEEFNRLYLTWITARWDEGDVWVRSVWTKRPS